MNQVLLAKSPVLSFASVLEHVIHEATEDNNPNHARALAAALKVIHTLLSAQGYDGSQGRLVQWTANSPLIDQVSFILFDKLSFQGNPSAKELLIQTIKLQDLPITLWMRRILFLFERSVVDGDTAIVQAVLDVTAQKQRDGIDDSDDPNRSFSATLGETAKYAASDLFESIADEKAAAETLTAMCCWRAVCRSLYKTRKHSIPRRQFRLAHWCL